MPCGAPSYSFKVAPFTILDERSAEAPMPAQRADRRDLAGPRPAGDGLGVHAEKRCNLCMREQCIRRGVVGHLNSGVTIPASAVYNQAGLPMISGSATNPKVTEQGFKNVFRTVGRDDQQGPAIATYVANEMKAKKVAIADDATAYGEGLARRVRELADGEVTAALDASGTIEALHASLELVADKTRIGTVAYQPAAEELGVKRLSTERSAEQLRYLTSLYAAGSLRASIQHAYTLEEAAEAHHAVETGHVRGKVVLKP